MTIGALRLPKGSVTKLVVFTSTVIAATVLAGTSTANPPVHVRLPLSITEPSPEYSAACGFEVDLSANGTVDVTVHTNQDA